MGSSTCPSSATRQRRRAVAALLELLENRPLLSAFYDYDILASTGDSVGNGFTISSINPETSVNDNGRVAFVATGAGPSS